MLMSGFLYSWKKSIAASQLAFEKQDSHEKPLQFSLDPVHGESGFSQWKSAMKMVVQLPEGIPAEFRRKLWINLSEKYLASRKINWEKVEADCFSEWVHAADTELDVQIVKDLHRTGCSLFCGENGQEKQAVLKKVLLAYARWNKHVGYCQGFNMLAALILQVTEGCEADALKIMIFLIEGVLPESYFADSLRGLSIDMVVFRELLKTTLPQLSNHLDRLQHTTNDGSVSYEPPLTNVFTMQWFLTIFCNCLPHTTVLRVWDLIFLEGNDVLLRAALGIWKLLEERIMTVRNADEFYCIMGVLTREMLELDLVDANILVKLIMDMGPLKELRNLREKYLYNINPWVTPRNSTANEVNSQLKLYQKENLKLDISALKQQYIKLKHRQRQAHIIFNAAINKQPPPSSPPIAINHLLLGKSAILPSKRIGPPKGSIPPPRRILTSEPEIKPCDTLHWKDAEPRRLSTSSSSSSDTELCDDPDDNDEVNEKRKKIEIKNPEVDSPSINNSLLNIEEDKYNPSIGQTNKSGETTPIDNKFLKIDTEQTAESSDSELDELYFEQFLQKRVETLTVPSITEQTGSKNNSQPDRRESRQRALEIIQENSLILHRILQCQSKHNSPEKTDTYSREKYDTVKETDTLEETHDDSRKSMYFETESSDYREFNISEPLPTLEETSKIVSSSFVNDTISDSYSTKFLETFYENFESKSPPELPELDFTPGEISLPSKKYSDYLDVRNELDDDYSRALDKKFEELVLKPNRPDVLEIESRDSEENNLNEDVDRCKLNKNEKTEEIAYGRPEVRHFAIKKSPCKSPTSDPFPVHIRSRQNKDVCVRLGLYKK